MVGRDGCGVGRRSQFVAVLTVIGENGRGRAAVIRCFCLSPTRAARRIFPIINLKWEKPYARQTRR